MSRPVGERRKIAIELRLAHRWSTSAIARELNVGYATAHRYLESVPLTPEEIAANTAAANRDRWVGHVKAPRSREKQRRHCANHYAKNKQQYLRRNQKRTEAVKNQIQDIKSRTSCVDCGNRFHFAAMDFDHRDGVEKRFEIGRRYSLGSMKSLLKEISKCDIVCSNCHRVRTYNRIQKKKLTSM